MLIFTCLHLTHLYFVADFLLFYRGTNMVQIYDENPRNKQIYQKVLKTKVGCNSLSYTLLFYR